jgi:hypothetical protein
MNQRSEPWPILGHLRRWSWMVEFEKQFMEEVGRFKDAEHGVSGDLVMAALIARREQKFDLLRLIHERRVEPTQYIDDDDLFCISLTDGKEGLTFKWVS